MARGVLYTIGLGVGDITKELTLFNLPNYKGFVAL